MTSFLPFLAVLFALSFALAFALTKLAFSVVFVLFAFAFAGLAFGFVVRARPFICLVVLQVFSFLSTVSRHVAVNSTP